MIVEPAVLFLVLSAALALNLTPGADMMFCLGQGLRGGARAARAADAGLARGCVAHVTVAGAGRAAPAALFSRGWRCVWPFFQGVGREQD